MGEMGGGISLEDQINIDLDNQFTTKWGEQQVYRLQDLDLHG
jgi:hypothetical protein